MLLLITIKSGTYNFIVYVNQNLKYSLVFQLGLIILIIPLILLPWFRIHQLYPQQKFKTPFQKPFSWFWCKEAPLLASGEYPFIALALRSTLIQNGRTCYGSIYESNRSVWKLFICDRNMGNCITVCKKWLLSKRNSCCKP